MSTLTPSEELVSLEQAAPPAEDNEQPAGETWEDRPKARPVQRVKRTQKDERRGEMRRCPLHPR